MRLAYYALWSSAQPSSGDARANRKRRSMSTNHVYDLRRGNHHSDGFYAELNQFADEVVAGIERRASPLLDGYSQHVKDSLDEPERSRGEHTTEFLMLGMALRRYEGAAQTTPKLIVELARELFWLRSRSALLKPLVDWVRAGIAKLVLVPHIGRASKSGGTAVQRMTALVEWLKATGEFEQEVMRLSNWRSYLAGLKPDKAAHWMGVATEIFAQFELKAETVLGSYTRGVENFLAGEHAHLRWREDALFCGRRPAEYHLNMVAQEVMNRGLRADFEKAPNKVVLLPRCMRGARGGTCKAKVNGLDMTCTGCDPACDVNRITERMKLLGAKVYMVPHSSGFSRWLKRWEEQKDTGVTAVACLLNILPGGYEMRARGIASQCVPLDFPGCRKHWDRIGIPTAVNVERLVQIVGQPITNQA